MSMDDSCRVQMNAAETESPDHLSTTSSPKTPKYLYSCPLRRQQHVTEKNVAWSFVCSVIGVLLALATGVPTMAVLALLVPVILTLRRSVTSCCHQQQASNHNPVDLDQGTRSCCCCCCGCGCVDDGSKRCQPGSPVAPLDAVWLQPHAFGCSVVHSVLIVDGALSVDKVKELLLSRLLGGQDSRGNRLYPRFCQKVVAVLSGYRWVDDACFDIDNHVVSYDERISSHSDLELLVGALVTKPLLFDRPLWQVLVLESCLEVSSVNQTTRDRDTVLVIRTHQCLTDGMSLLTLLRTSLADHPTTPAAVASATTFRPHFGGMVFPLNVLRACVVGPWTMFCWLFCGRKDCNPLSRGVPQSGFGANGRVVVGWSDAVDLARVTRVKQVTRSTVNDVLMAALAGSLRAYFQQQGVQRPYDIKVSLPIDLRYEPKQLKRPVSLGTEFAAVNVSLPTSREGAIPRLWEVRGITDDLKTSADPVVMYGALYFLQALLPECAATAIINRLLNRASLAMHNVPGPEAALFLASRRLKTILCLIPPRDSVAVSVTVVTYADTLRVALLADLSVLPDPQPVIREFHAQINIMATLLANRRLPGEHRRRSFQIHPMNNFTQHPQLEQIQQKLHDVQEELQELSERLDGASSSHPLRVGEQELQTRLEELKEEFLELLTELRRRKSIAEGVSLSDDDEDLDGELRRPRRRAMSISSRKSSVSVTSTSRPLTTPTTSQHSVLAQLMDDAAASANFDQYSNRSLSPSQDH